MIVKHLEEKEKKFEPIVVQFTLESKEELQSIVQRLNVSDGIAQEHGGCAGADASYNGGSMELLNMLNKKLESL